MTTINLISFKTHRLRHGLDLLLRGILLLLLVVAVLVVFPLGLLGSEWAAELCRRCAQLKATVAVAIAVVMAELVKPKDAEK